MLCLDDGVRAKVFGRPEESTLRGGVTLVRRFDIALSPTVRVSLSDEDVGANVVTGLVSVASLSSSDCAMARNLPNPLEAPILVFVLVLLRFLRTGGLSTSAALRRVSPSAPFLLSLSKVGLSWSPPSDARCFSLEDRLSLLARPNVWLRLMTRSSSSLSSNARGFPLGRRWLVLVSPEDLRLRPTTSWPLSSDANNFLGRRCSPLAPPDILPRTEDVSSSLVPSDSTGFRCARRCSLLAPPDRRLRPTMGPSSSSVPSDSSDFPLW